MGSQGRRSTPLPKGWHRIRRRILKRDGHSCQWPMLTGGVCAEPATDVDHRVNAAEGGGDDDANLWALCGWHHNHKTAGEASRAAHARPPRNRPPDAHPGLLP
jgi:5-methylcytosine-specific restriction protein A